MTGISVSVETEYVSSTMKLEEFDKRIVEAIRSAGRPETWTSMGITDTADRRYHPKGPQDPYGLAIVHWGVPPIPCFGALYALSKDWGVRLDYVTEYQTGYRNPIIDSVSEWMAAGQKLRRRYGG